MQYVKTFSVYSALLFPKPKKPTPNARDGFCKFNICGSLFYDKLGGRKFISTAQAYKVDPCIEVINI